MNRRRFVSAASMASSAVFIGAGGIKAIDTHLLQAKILLTPSEYMQFKGFAQEFTQQMESHAEYPSYFRSFFHIDSVVARSQNKFGCEVKLQNSKGDIIVLVKKEKKELVKVL